MINRFFAWLSRLINPVANSTRGHSQAEKSAEVIEDPRDFAEPGFGKPDFVVSDRIDRSIEQLQEHMEVPTLGAYELFLYDELEWIEHEKRIRRALASSLP